MSPCLLYSFFILPPPPPPTLDTKKMSDVWLRNFNIAHLISNDITLTSTVRITPSNENYNLPDMTDMQVLQLKKSNQHDEIFEVETELSMARCNSSQEEINMMHYILSVLSLERKRFCRFYSTAKVGLTGMPTASVPASFCPEFSPYTASHVSNGLGLTKCSQGLKSRSAYQYTALKHVLHKTR